MPHRNRATSSPVRWWAPSARRAGAFGDDRVLIERYPKRRAISGARVSATRTGNISCNLWDAHFFYPAAHHKIVE